MQGVKGIGMAALAIQFFVELLGIVAVAYWGLQTGPEESAGSRWRSLQPSR